MSTASDTDQITVVKDGCVQRVDLTLLHTVTGTPFVPYLEFASLKILCKSKRKKALSRDRRWLSAYFRKEVLGNVLPAVSLRWIDEGMGWGVFAEKDFQAMEWIGEYTGIVRKRGRRDSKNAYCFEYTLDHLIDGETQGGISRYINHSCDPNMFSAFTVVDGVPHIILYTAKKILKGTELCYDYGPDYWKRRKKPR